MAARPSPHAKGGIMLRLDWSCINTCKHGSFGSQHGEISPKYKSIFIHLLLSKLSVGSAWPPTSKGKTPFEDKEEEHLKQDHSQQKDEMVDLGKWLKVWSKSMKR